eukprot:295105_1
METFCNDSEMSDAPTTGLMECQQWNRDEDCPLAISNSRGIAINDHIFLMSGGGCFGGQCFDYNISQNKWKLFCNYPDFDTEGNIVIDITDSKLFTLYGQYTKVLNFWFERLEKMHTNHNDMINVIMLYSQSCLKYILSFGFPHNKFQQITYDINKPIPNEVYEWKLLSKHDIKLGEGAKCCIAGKNKHLLIVTGGIDTNNDIFIFDVNNSLKMIKHIQNILPFKCSNHGFVNYPDLCNKFFVWGIEQTYMDNDESDEHDGSENKRFCFEMLFDENKLQFQFNTLSANQFQTEFSTFVVYKNKHIISFGGHDDEDEPTNIISYYSFPHQKWYQSIIKLPEKLSGSTAVLSNDYDTNKEIIVHIFGGDDDWDDERRCHFYINCDKLLRSDL